MLEFRAVTRWTATNIKRHKLVCLLLTRTLHERPSHAYIMPFIFLNKKENLKYNMFVRRQSWYICSSSPTLQYPWLTKFLDIYLHHQIVYPPLVFKQVSPIRQVFKLHLLPPPRSWKQNISILGWELQCCQNIVLPFQHCLRTFSLGSSVCSISTLFYVVTLLSHL